MHTQSSSYNPEIQKVLNTEDFCTLFGNKIWPPELIWWQNLAYDWLEIIYSLYFPEWEYCFTVKATDV